MSQGGNEGVTVGAGRIDGKGVFATRPFSEGDIVVKYHLIPLSDDVLRRLPRSETRFVHHHEGREFLYGVPERYVNGSRVPNTKQDFDQEADIAIRPICPGEEVTTDPRCDDQE
jgi:hypothetical protein